MVRIHALKDYKEFYSDIPLANGLWGWLRSVIVGQPPFIAVLLSPLCSRRFRLFFPTRTLAITSRAMN